MKMPAVNITTDDFVKMVKKRWPIVVSITILVLFVATVMWSLLFISGTMQRALGVDEERVQGEIPSIDMDLYRSLKPQWKDFVGGKYIGPTNTDTSSTNVNTNTSGEIIDINAGNTNQ